MLTFLVLTLTIGPADLLVTSLRVSCIVNPVDTIRNQTIVHPSGPGMIQRAENS